MIRTHCKVPGKKKPNTCLDTEDIDECVYFLTTRFARDTEDTEKYNFPRAGDSARGKGVSCFAAGYIKAYKQLYLCILPLDLIHTQGLVESLQCEFSLIFKGEAQDSIYMTYAALYDEVARLAASLKTAGVVPGERVVGFMPNMPQSIIAMLN